MARTFWDSYDVYATEAQIAVKWQVYSGVSFVTGRFGGRAARISSGGGSRLSRTIPATDRHSVGTAMRVTGFNRPQLMGAGFFNSTLAVNNPANRQVGWSVDVEGRIIVYRGASTVLWQSEPGVVVNAAWIFIGFSAIIHPSNGSFSLSANGVQLVEQTGINTRGQPNDNITCVNVATGSIASLANFDIDDTYFDDEYLSLVPERRIETLRPVSDGATLDLIPSTGTSHFAVVDDELVDTADFLSGSLPGELSELVLSDLSVVPTVIDGVQAAGFAFKTDAATRAVNYGVRSNGEDELGTPVTLTTTVQQGFNNVLLNPDGDVAWDAAAVNATRLLLRIAT